MKTRIFSYFFLLFCLNEAVESCLISIKPKLDRPNIKYKEIPRKVYTNPKDMTEKCVCGMETSYRHKDWNIYIQVKRPNASLTEPCLGTVIAHNLVVTSHHCLAMERNAVRPYDVWQVAPKHRTWKMAFANGSNVKMTIKILRNFTVFKTNTRKVEAIKVIYNPAHSGFAGVEVASANDIALIVTKDDLFKTFYFDDLVNATAEPTPYPLRLPICLPAVDERRHVLESTLHKFGYYYGYDASYATIVPLKMKVANEIRVLDGSACDEEAGFGKFSTPGSLCIRTPVGLPKREGGPLIVTDGLGPMEMPHEYAGDFNLLTHVQTAFLLGINTVAEKRVPGKRLTYSYFANVLQNLEFIETTAEKENSSWCDTTPFPHTASEQKWEEWPWETNPVKPRSKTLDCACGLSNSKKESVPGGENAVPYEFGWMARFTFSYRPNNREFKENISYYCGASVINDRVLLTAGHCLIQPKNELVFLDEVPFPTIQDYKLFIGLHNGNESLETNSKKANLSVKAFMVHPGFIPHQKSFISSDDVVVMILGDPLKFDIAKTKDQVKKNDIRPICLPEISKKVELKAKTKLTAVGWGILHENKTDSSGKPKPDVLQKIQITAQSMKHCREATEALIPDTVFCVENFRKDYTTTEGDSGGPVSFIQQPNGQHFQVGLISYGITPSKLDFFVDIHNYLPFIEYYSAMEGAQWCKY